MKKRLWKRWYPRTWRNRYGEEYEQLLEDLAADDQMTWRNEVNVVRTGLALRRVYPGRRIAFSIGTAAVVALVAFAVGFSVRSSSVQQIGFVGPASIQRCVRVTGVPKGKVQVQTVTPGPVMHLGQLVRRSGSVRISIVCSAVRAGGKVTIFPPARLIAPASLLPPTALRGVSAPSPPRVPQSA